MEKRDKTCAQRLPLAIGKQQFFRLDLNLKKNQISKSNKKNCTNLIEKIGRSERNKVSVEKASLQTSPYTSPISPDPVTRTHNTYYCPSNRYILRCPHPSTPPTQHFPNVPECSRMFHLAPYSLP